jgi:putative spermidine/putrescine transport system permease protein
VLLSPLILPQIVTGAALLQFFALVGLRDLLGFPALLLGHVVVTLPYAIRTVMVSLHGLDPRLEWAAQDLGADPVRTFLRVTLPLIKNGVFAGFVFAFIVSFNDVPISLFLGRPGNVPIPIAILGHVESRFDPAVAAVAVITIAIVLALIAVAERFARVSEFIYQQER